MLLKCIRKHFRRNRLKNRPNVYEEQQMSTVKMVDWKRCVGARMLERESEAKYFSANIAVVLSVLVTVARP